MAQFFSELALLYTSMFIQSFFFLLSLWIIFSGKFDALHFGLGVLCCAALAWVSKDLIFREKTSFLRQVRILAKMIYYGFWLIWQIVLSNFFMFKLVFHPNLDSQLDPQLVDINVTDLPTDFAKVVLAQSITLTPGTITLTCEQKKLRVYAINPTVVPGLEDMHKLVNWVFR